ncbi:hypothetical protein OF83DRAFT_1082641 [Amylostereum chailletii]|nr:hypothetical protein OF83DRAFT_1082641 [Amylostereum chailletii]
MLGRFTASGAGAQIDAQCPPRGAGPHSLPYTGRAPADSRLCFLVTCFHAAFHAPTAAPLVRSFGASLATAVVLPTLESARTSSPPPSPPAFGALYQVLGAGVALPLFWAAMIYSGHARMRPGPSAAIDRAAAEAALGALLVAYVAPSVLMLVRVEPRTTALWQAFPAGLALYLRVRPRAHAAESGHACGRATYGVAFVFSAVVHAAHAAPLLRAGGVSALAAQFVPPVAVGARGTATVAEATVEFLQWDMAFTFGSGFVGALWFAESAREGVGMVMMWSVGAACVLGPGAAMAGLLMWREERLNGGVKEEEGKRA